MLPEGNYFEKVGTRYLAYRLKKETGKENGVKMSTWVDIIDIAYYYSGAISYDNHEGYHIAKVCVSEPVKSKELKKKIVQAITSSLIGHIA